MSTIKPSDWAASTLKSLQTRTEQELNTLFEQLLVGRPLAAFSMERTRLIGLLHVALLEKQRSIVLSWQADGRLTVRDIAADATAQMNPPEPGQS
jgi:hypothetical protein